MDNTTSIILSRMITASRTVDVIANNIANVATPGYEAIHLKSAAWIDRMRGVTAPPGGSTLSYTQAIGTWRDATPGAVHQTGNPLDLALPGGGYFTVATANGPRLTRDGRFGLLPNGTIANASGDALLDAGGQPITVPPQSGTLTIAADGTISTAQGIIGQVGVVTVPDPQTLKDQGGNLFQTTVPPVPSANPGIVQGAVEGSNVQPIVEITKMIEASQNFRMIAQFVTAERARDQSAISKILGATTS
ncbi:MULTISPECIES: flagellar hook-basal body complex protein [Acidiphilium]|uniref:Flagellar basal-body rod protein FlgF n=1 Tax=Acidiphilium rubrum TaxID=526 RepID=A0A8G2CJG5_ACIRU|nr:MULTISPECIES: flagellar hook-basal body complex protein [Acidiphilium]SIQ50680.1 flagellar basal-body rod protein FlgF [Acidiphilium rubrum]